MQQLYVFTSQLMLPDKKIRNKNMHWCCIFSFWW